MPVPVRIAMIAALPREIAGLVRGTAADAALRKEGVWLYRVEGAVVVAAGMGKERAAVAVEAALAGGEVGMLISTGLAGACVPGVEAGSVMEAGVVVDAETGERVCCGERGGRDAGDGGVDCERAGEGAAGGDVWGGAGGYGGGDGGADGAGEGGGVSGDQGGVGWV